MMSTDASEIAAAGSFTDRPEGADLPDGAGGPNDAGLLAVVPALNEEAALAACLAPLVDEGARVVVVDGGSTDATCAIAERAGARVLRSARGRAVQMNAGAAVEPDAAVLVFVHADTVLSPGWRREIEQALAAGARWGRFDVRLRSPRPLLRVVASMMNLRSRFTGICTGDQAIFVCREAWQRCGGFARMPLMEDIELSARLRAREGPPAALRLPVAVSARRWEARGVLRTILLMWLLRALYFLGASPKTLHRLYYGRTG